MDDVIICVGCGKRLFHCLAIGRVHAGANVNVEDFVPVSDDVPQPNLDDEMICPFCKKMFGKPAISPGETNGVVFRLEDGSWWPSPPIRSGPKKGLTP